MYVCMYIYIYIWSSCEHAGERDVDRREEQTAERHGEPDLRDQPIGVLSFYVDVLALFFVISL